MKEIDLIHIIKVQKTIQPNKIAPYEYIMSAGEMAQLLKVRLITKTIT